MCTVSIVGHTGGVRLMCNRDERTDRPEALPPVRRDRPGGGWTVAPIDPLGGGTWFGANDRGLVLTVLNQSSATPRAAPMASRGLVIPPLLQLDGLGAVARAMSRFDPTVFAPFRLLALQRALVLVASWTGGRLALETRGVGVDVEPLLFTSSGLGDELADQHRRPWFDRLVCEAGNRLEGQCRFHRDGWTADPRFGVLLDRAGVRTVSWTAVDLDPAGLVTRVEYAGRRIDAAA